MDFIGLYPDAKRLANFFRLLTSIDIDEATLQMSGDGIKIRELNPSGTCALELFIPSGSFTKFELKENCKIRFDVEWASKWLDRTGQSSSFLADLKKSIVAFDFVEKGSERLTLPLIYIPKEEMPTLKIKSNATMTLDLSIFSSLVENARMVSDEINLRATGNELCALAGGPRSPETRTVLDKKTSGVKKYNVKGVQGARYPVEYLSSLCKPAGEVFEKLELSFSSNQPLILLLESSLAKAKYYVAPRA